MQDQHVHVPTHTQSTRSRLHTPPGFSPHSTTPSLFVPDCASQFSKMPHFHFTMAPMPGTMNADIMRLLSNLAEDSISSGRQRRRTRCAIQCDHVPPAPTRRASHGLRTRCASPGGTARALRASCCAHHCELLRSSTSQALPPPPSPPLLPTTHCRVCRRPKP